MKIAYARVSTRKQSRDGNGLADQIAQLKLAGYDELIEEQFSGSTTNRPALDSLIKRLKSGDTLIVTKLDRFARSTAQGSALISDLLNKGVAVHILNMGLIDNTSTGKLITNILLAFAEYERDMIVERTQAGKEIARTKDDFRDERKPIDFKRKKLSANLFLYSYKQAERLIGLSQSTISRAVRAISAEKILSLNDQ